MRCPWILSLCLLLTTGGGAAAEPMMVSFTGTIITATGVFAGQGSLVLGSVTYDSELAELNPDSTGPDNDFFRADRPASNQDLDWAIEVEVGNVFATTANNDDSDFSNHHQLELFDRTGLDEFNIVSNAGLPDDDSASVSLRGIDLLFPGSGNLTGMADTLSGFDLSAATLAFGRFEVFEEGMPGVAVSQGELAFEIDAVTLPEPALASSLSALVALALLRVRRPRNFILRAR